MGSDSQYQIPAIEFIMNSPEMDRGTDEWYHLCKKVREACENYGCFEIVYDKIPPQLRAETFSASRKLFSLPLETKKQNLNPKPYQGYVGPSVRAPLYEGFGFEEASNYESLGSLTEDIWSHDQFCTVISMMKQLDELKDMINLMILDSYGLEETSNLIMVSKTLLRLQKYTAPPSREYTMGSPAHTDKNFGTILFDDQVSGLEVQTKDEQWVKLSISPRSFVFVVGDSLMAWSNGRMHSVNHRVMMCGEKERHSLAAFALPIEGSIIKAQKELVDEDYPRILKDFDYTDFSKFIFSEGRAIESQMQVFAYAGIRT
ncbi:putative oxoglutarate/iron-dependent dioxygenase, non-heme dioxygenase domain-containing protein [Rosa chinensis]|uniref:Putative oxoglutarate/iron-dependent dioxygenase, non-heme dioxygenase domain-containing protein n=1 Tax=Rosa chinensis TaxID=74649 RepID=A0A2P6QCY6_ROSCH|nr:probable 2-oxoglutarate-dependent dioxygenase AOP1 [Rosa chinensis]XP_040361395.1 probable 2-oxoglutarate-dependent dioxygenase AOP1 [Rosa chinensis]XP_040361396.1 probable 2-oxoglutarate-dependent dioxygenase AOP1 [Rosa chinensis]XP_040361397.1 probable 2-oxoglutarate-dependent dioxygenase AOP1 [Rosa chinensis]XP_040361398.1 probable 2-oxoglutarate-dependent dioxygenase AOP1 [Rosa chinensis]XP_040361399.1 probable 2-oxoglutarate-dependent dioxygenase AOP1 [Rosa chinensis]PRQ32040.1 putati